MNTLGRTSVVVLPMLLAAMAVVRPAEAQSQLMCLNQTYNAWEPCSLANPLPIYPPLPTHVQTATLASNLVVKGSSGYLYSFEVAADSTLLAADWWLMIFDATTLPADGAVTPAKCYHMVSGTPGFSWGLSSPQVFLTGIVIGVSTTGCFTKTASAHAFIAGDFE
jgi:hypothetical protein